MASRDISATIAYHYGSAANNGMPFSPHWFSPRVLLIVGVVVLCMMAASRAGRAQTQIDVLMAYTPTAEAAVTDINAQWHKWQTGSSEGWSEWASQEAPPGVQLLPANR